MKYQSVNNESRSSKNWELVIWQHHLKAPYPCAFPSTLPAKPDPERVSSLPQNQVNAIVLRSCLHELNPVIHPTSTACRDHPLVCASWHLGSIYNGDGMGADYVLSA